MIEIKYDEEKNTLKLPKNIRQVGKPNDKIKIYVEDYVITYINQITEKSNNEQKLAILLGKIVKNKDVDIAFIEGALEIREVKIQEDNICLTTQIWTNIYDEVRKYFHDEEIIGWFLTRPGKSLGINEKITKIHVDNFPGKNKTLFMADPIDKDEAFFVYRNGSLVGQEGYYIYYDRNEAMQNYMVETNNYSGEEPAVKAASVDKKISEATKRESKVKEFPRFKRGQAESDRQRPVYMNAFLKNAMSFVVTFVILFALIIGITMINNNQSEQVISNNPDNAAAAAQSETEDVIPVEVIDGNIEESSLSTPSTVSTPSTEETVPTESETEAPQEETQEVITQAVSAEPKTYTVKDGDTLAGISYQFYSSISYVDKIRELNGIEDVNRIYPGMTITLP